MAAEESATASYRRTMRRVYIAAGVVCALVTATMIGKFLAGDFKDAHEWYDAGRRVLNGQSLLRLPHYRYPPAFAVVVSSLCALPFSAFFFLWYGLNVLLFGLAVRLSVGLCSSREGPARPMVVWLPALLVVVYAIDNLFLGQTNILIMVLVYWTFLEMERGRGWLAGLPLGAAVALKVFPAPLLAYLVYRLRLRAAAAALLSCAFILLLMPAPVRGFRRNLSELGDWASRVVLPYVSRGEAGDWGQHSVDFGNQSLPAQARRFLTHVDAQVAARREKGAPSIYVNIANLTEPQLNGIVVGLFAGLGVCFVAACGLRRPGSREQRVAEYSLSVTLLLMVSAISWTYFFVMLLLPATTAVWLLGKEHLLRGVTARAALRVAVGVLAIALPLLASHWARALGNLFWAALVLFAALALACWDMRRAGTAGELDAALRQ